MTQNIKSALVMEEDMAQLKNKFIGVERGRWLAEWCGSQATDQSYLAEDFRTMGTEAGKAAANLCQQRAGIFHEISNLLHAEVADHV